MAVTSNILGRMMVESLAWLLFVSWPRTKCGPKMAPARQKIKTKLRRYNMVLPSGDSVCLQQDVPTRGIGLRSICLACAYLYRQQDSGSLLVSAVLLTRNSGTTSACSTEGVFRAASSRAVRSTLAVRPAFW